MTKATDDKPNSRNIPLPIQREVRKHCGFGCVICGLPLYEYDHLLGWAKVQRHSAEEITLLCDRHHREKTNGLLPDATVKEANANPYNLQKGVSPPYDLHYDGKSCEIEIGSNRFTLETTKELSVLVPIMIDGVPILAFIIQDSHLLLNVTLYDENNDIVLKINNNQLFYSTTSWDIQLVGQNLIIRDGSHKILVDIVFDVPNRIQVNRGRILRNGVELLIRPNGVIISNNGTQFSGAVMENCPVGFLIGPHDPPISAMIAMLKLTRYVHDKAATDLWIQEQFPDREPA